MLFPLGDFYLLFLGFCAGSFIHTTAFRLVDGKSLLDRSACDACGKKLNFIELIPVIGFLFRRGICPSCGVKIPSIYPILELTTGIMFWLVYKNHGLSWELLLILAYWSALAMVAIADAKSMLVLWQPVIFAFLVRAIQLWYFRDGEIQDSLIGMLCGAGAFHFIGYFYLVLRGRVGLGDGDTTLIGLIGFFLGWKLLIPMIFIASILGIIFFIGLRIFSKRGFDQPSPFGPPLILASFAVYVEPRLVELFFSIF